MTMRDKLLAAAETGAYKAGKIAADAYRDENGRRTKVMGWEEALNFGHVSEPGILYNAIVDAVLDAMREPSEGVLQASVVKIENPHEGIPKPLWVNLSPVNSWQAMIDAIKAGK